MRSSTTKIMYSVLLVAGSTFLSGCNNLIIPPIPQPLPERFLLEQVPLVAQQTPRWCWAASLEMCLRYFGVSNFSQCAEANRNQGMTDCCRQPVPGPCYTNGNFPNFQLHQISCDSTAFTALSWNDIRRQIYTLRKPVIGTWRFPGGGGHMMVVTGYYTEDGVNWLNVNDPLEVNQGSMQTITYQDYVSRGTHHSHGDDYYNLTKR